jgi:hypothetical protein
MLALGLAVLASPGAPASIVIGKVHRVVKNTIEINSDSGRVVLVKTDATTKYTNSRTEKPAEARDMAVGDEVVVKVISKDSGNVAEEIRFLPTGARKKADKP